MAHQVIEGRVLKLLIVECNTEFWHNSCGIKAVDSLKSKSTERLEQIATALSCRMQGTHCIGYVWLIVWSVLCSALKWQLPFNTLQFLTFLQIQTLLNKYQTILLLIANLVRENGWRILLLDFKEFLKLWQSYLNI